MNELAQDKRNWQAPLLVDLSVFGVTASGDDPFSTEIHCTDYNGGGSNYTGFYALTSTGRVNPEPC